MTIDDSLYNLLKKKYPGFNPYKFMGKYKRKYSESVIMDFLMNMARYNTIRCPWAVAEKALPILQQNQNEREHIRKAQEDKDVFSWLLEGIKKMQGEE